MLHKSLCNPELNNGFLHSSDRLDISRSDFMNMSSAIFLALHDATAGQDSVNRLLPIICSGNVFLRGSPCRAPISNAIAIYTVVLSKIIQALLIYSHAVEKVVSCDHSLHSNLDLIVTENFIITSFYFVHIAVLTLIYIKKKIRYLNRPSHPYRYLPNLTF